MATDKDEHLTTRKTGIGLYVVIALNAIMVWRVSALTYLAQVGDTIPDFWGIAFKGDAFIGFTAPVVAFLLYRYRNLSVWTLGVVWQCIGLFDLWVAIESQFILPLGQGPYFVIPTGMVMHSVALYLLVRARSNYAEGLMPAGVSAKPS